MAMKYNRALDLLCAAAEFHTAGKYNSAAKAMAAACKDPSIKAALSIVEASNSKAHAELTASKKATRAATFDDAIDHDEPGEELRMVPDENDDRIVQESGFEDDEDETVEAAADEDEDADEEVEKAEAALKAAKARAAKASAKQPVKSNAQARLAQAMKNFDAVSK